MSRRDAKPISQSARAFRLAYKIFSYATLAGLALTLMLVVRKAPPPKVSYDPNASERVQEKFVAADEVKAAGQPAQVSLDSTEVNSYLADNLDLPGGPPPTPADPAQMAAAQQSENVAASGPGVEVPSAEQPSLEEVQSSVRDVKVKLDGNLVKAYVVFSLHGEDLSLELDGHLGSDNGYMKFDPVAGWLGSLPLPESALHAAVGRLMDSPENRDKLRLPDDINDVRVLNGQIVFNYK